MSGNTFIVKFTKGDVDELVRDIVTDSDYRISEAEPFSSCCGAYEIGNFPEDSILQDVVENVRESLLDNADFDGDKFDNGCELFRKITADEVRPTIIDALKEQISDALPKAPVIATTLVKSQEFAAAALEKAGFVEQFRWTNPNSGNRLIFWLRKPPRS